MPDDARPESPLDQFVHDIQNCLHVIGMVAETLKAGRVDEQRAAELLTWIDEERLRGVDLVEAFARRSLAADRSTSAANPS